MTTATRTSWAEALPGNTPGSAASGRGLSAVPLRRVVFVLGAGGVGKTTCSVVLAHGLALLGKRVMLLTVDPARRLEDLVGKLSVGHPNLSVQKVQVEEQFAQFIRAHSPEQGVAQRVLGSRFFPYLSRRLQALHEYVAAELIASLVQEGSYDHIVVDTPPFAYAVHFLEAPARLNQMATLASTLFAAGSAGRAAVKSLSPLLVKGLSHFLGQGFFHELIEFLASFGKLWDGIEKSTRRTVDLFRFSTSFVLVFRPDDSSVTDLLHLLGKRPEWLQPHLLIANRTLDVPNTPPSHLATAHCTDNLQDAGPVWDPVAVAWELREEKVCRSWNDASIDAAVKGAIHSWRLAQEIRRSQDAALEKLAKVCPAMVMDRVFHLPQIPGGVRTPEQLDCLARDLL